MLKITIKNKNVVLLKDPMNILIKTICPMKNVKKILLSLFAILFLAFFVPSCSESDNNSGGTSRLKVSLTDNPGDYDEVNVEIIDVKVKYSSNTDESGWVSIGIDNPGVYNLLDLTGGVTAALADAEIPSGFLGQIRLILGENNTVVKDGMTYPLNTPSAQQSGLKLQVNQTLEPNFTYDFLLDFDVNYSVVVEAGGSGNFNLHPVLRVISMANTGSISGTVDAGGFQVLASVMVNGVEVSAYTNSEGIFHLHGIPAGTYTVTLTPDPESTFSPLIIENVEVVNGVNTDTGLSTISN